MPGETGHHDARVRVVGAAHARRPLGRELHEVQPDRRRQVSSGHGLRLVARDRAGLDRVFLAAPSSTDARLAETVAASRGFVYAVSTMGITGARADVDAKARDLVARLRAAGATGPETIAACVGIGISTPEQVSEVLGYADGAIVGSALVSALAEDGVAGVARLASALSHGK